MTYIVPHAKTVLLTTIKIIFEAGGKCQIKCFGKIIYSILEDVSFKLKKYQKEAMQVNFSVKIIANHLPEPFEMPFEGILMPDLHLFLQSIGRKRYC